MEQPIIISIALVVDATGSMATTLTALKPALTQLTKLVPLFAMVKFHLVIYRDFDQPIDMVYQYHGPFLATESDSIEKIITSTVATGGGDDAECQKFAFNRLLSDITDDNLVVFHFTDAPPHTYPFPTQSSKSEHYKEGYNLKINNFVADWMELCNLYQNRRIPVYTIGAIKNSSYPYYTILAEMTGADVILLDNTDSTTILKVTTIICARALGYNDCNLMGLGSVIKLEPNFVLPLTENSIEFRNIKILITKQTDETQSIDVRSVFDVCNRKSLEKRYNEDSSYRNICFETFTSLINSGHILSLTYNPLLGNLYRQMCKKTRVVDVDEKRYALTNLMSLTMSKLKTQNLASYDILAKWMEDSFNSMEKINELIMGIDGLMYPFLVLQTTDADRMTKKDLVNAVKIPQPHNLRLLSNLISNIMIVDQKPNIMPEVFVPISASNQELFSLLSHLMCPGVMAELKPSIVLALVTLDSGNAYLADRALDFLRENAGCWFDQSETEWYLFGFIKMLFRLNDKYNGIITDTESGHLKSFFKIASLKQNNPEIDCIVPLNLTSGYGSTYSDHKVKCKLCDQFRSVSVMTSTGCGLCLSYRPETLAELQDPNASKSYLFDCINCGSRYAVRNIDNLNTKPKCHYCRNSIRSIPKIECSVCNINMILPDESQLVVSPTDIFMCAICDENNGIKKTNTISVRLHDLLKENNTMVEHLIGIKIGMDDLSNNKSLFSVKGKYEVIDEPNQITLLTYDSKPILNTDIIMKNLMTNISTGYINNETCNICYNTFIHSDLDSMCYNSGCKCIACKKCISMWFGENKPGCRILQNRMCCPSCKKFPLKGLAFTNLHLKTLLSQKITYDYNWHYAWCKQCNKSKEFMTRDCAGPDPMPINDFVCEDCKVPQDTRACPFCGIKTSKSAGCDHMECPTSLGGCGIHWCYRCASDTIFSATDARSVYDHLYNVHGNIYGDNA